MERQCRDPGADALLDLDGQVLVVDPEGRYWVKFSAQRVTPTTGRPKGLSYSLTLHDAGGARLIGFDNAHQVRKSRNPGGRGSGPFDHAHYLGAVRPYQFRGAAQLLEDFWTAVDRFLRQRGIVP